MKGDLTGVVPLLAAAIAKPYLRAALQEAFAAVCDAGEADAAALLLACDGIDGNAALNPGYVRPRSRMFRGRDCDHEEHLGYALNDEGNEEGDTVLTRAARRGTSGVVRALVASGKVDVNGAGPNGGLPLALAIRSKDTACVEALLSADGIDTNAPANPNYAEDHDDDDDTDGPTIRGMVKAGREGDTLLVRAVRQGNAGAVRALVKSGKADLNRAAPNCRAPLFEAIDSKDAACARARALASGKDIDLNLRGQTTGRTALHEVCAAKHAALAELLLLAGACRFARTTASDYNDTNAGDTALALAAGDKAVAKAFASGVDYWQRRLHGGHGWAMKEVVRTLLLVRQRLDAEALTEPDPATPGALPLLPEEIWLAALWFLRGADFMPAVRGVQRIQWG